MTFENNIYSKPSQQANSSHNLMYHWSRKGMFFWEKRKHNNFIHLLSGKYIFCALYAYHIPKLWLKDILNKKTKKQTNRKNPKPKKPNKKKPHLYSLDCLYKISSIKQSEGRSLGREITGKSHSLSTGEGTRNFVEWRKPKNQKRIGNIFV